MSGHSKWSTIHRQKETADQKRGQLFSKLGRMITIAARKGGDPETNFKLRLAMEKAKQANMPKENIERAIKKGSGEEGSERWEEVVYEGFGPGKVTIMVEAVTDNRNRTTAEIKNLFERGGGRLATPGAVAFQFKSAGLLTVKKETSPEEQILKIIDLGPEEVEEASDVIEVYAKPGELDQVKKKLETAGFSVLGAELVKQPTTVIKITDENQARRIIDFMNKLHDHDDIQRIFANFDIPDELVE